MWIRAVMLFNFTEVLPVDPPAVRAPFEDFRILSELHRYSIRVEHRAQQRLVVFAQLPLLVVQIVERVIGEMAGSRLLELLRLLDLRNQFRASCLRRREQRRELRFI